MKYKLTFEEEKNIMRLKKKLQSLIENIRNWNIGYI